MSDETQVIRVEQHGAVALLVIENPPVNALSHGLRQGIWDAIEAAETNSNVEAIAMVSVGRVFSAGADISEFGSAHRAPVLPDLCNRIEMCSKPVVAGLQGNALGGGFELALAAHFRLAAPGVRMGLPEVKLGLVPGAGGTQRVPRITGADAALKLMLSGETIGAETAEAAGLIDGIMEGDLTQACVLLAADLAGPDAGPRPTRERRDGFGDPLRYQEAIKAARKNVASDPIEAKTHIIDCVEAAQLLPFEGGMDFERAAFEDLLASDQSKALRHAFMAERLASKIPVAAGVTPRPVEHVGVIGGGTMGAGIAVALLNAGFDVTMVERDAASLETGLGRVVSFVERDLAKGRITEAECQQRLARLAGSDTMGPMGEVDLVIEAVPEEMALKADVMAKLGALMRPGAILATNTSYLDVNALALCSNRPADVIGLHFFAPAHVMKLLEIVVARDTAADVVATGLAIAKAMGKQPVRSGVADGFVGNRVLTAYRTAADHLLEDGATPSDVDNAMRDFGFKLGPYQVADLSGLDISWARRKRLAPLRDPSERYVTIGDRLCEAGRLGQKTGKGYYVYKEGNRKGKPDSEVDAIIAACREEAGIVPREVTQTEIAERCALAMVLAGLRLIEEGVAQRPSDIDVAMIHGFGFPRWKGGPMEWADLKGLPWVQGRLKSLAAIEDPRFWVAPSLLADLVKNGQKLADLNTL